MCVTVLSQVELYCYTPAVYEGIEPSPSDRQSDILSHWTNRPKIVSLSWPSPLSHRYYPYRSIAWLARFGKVTATSVSKPFVWLTAKCGSTDYSHKTPPWDYRWVDIHSFPISKPNVSYHLNVNPYLGARRIFQPYSQRVPRNVVVPTSLSLVRT